MSGQYDLKIMCIDEWLETISTLNRGQRERLILDRLLILRHLEKYVARLPVCGARYRAGTRLIDAQKHLKEAVSAMSGVQCGLFR